MSLAEKKKNLSDLNLDDCPSGKGFKIHIVVSDWNETITSKLYDGAHETLLKLGLDKDDIEVVRTPGAFELPAAAAMLLKAKAADGIICLGCVIKGDTQHDEYINSAVANGLTQLSVISGKPVTFGLLTVNTMEQAEERAGGSHGNKGVEAAVTAVKMVAIQKDLNAPKKSIGF